MKNTFKLLLIAGAAIALSSCTHKELETPAPGSAYLQVTAGVATRAVGTTWSEDETIGVIVTSAPEGSAMMTDYRNAKYSIASGADESTATFSATGDNSIFFDVTGNVTFAAYDPYYEGSVTAYPGTSGDGVISGSTADQKTTQESIDYLYADDATASSASPTVNFTFSHVMARLVVNFLPGTGFDANDVQTGAYTIDGLTHSGNFYVLADDDHDAGTACTDESASSTSDWDLVTYCPAETTTSGISFTAILYPHASIDGVILKAVVNGVHFSVPLATADITSFAGGYSYTYNITVSEEGLEVGGSTITDWDDTYSADIKADKDVTGDEEDEDDGTIDLSALTEDVTAAGYAYVASTNTLTLTSDCTLSTSGDTAFEGQIVISEGASNVTFDGLNVDCDESDKDSGTFGAVIINGGSKITLTLSGENKISTKDVSNSTIFDCIYVSGDNTELVIEGEGSLTLSEDNSSGQKGALILDNNASLTINSGTITATSGNQAAGIGAKNGGTCGDITINGGTIDATAGGLSAGIGSSYNGKCGNITINGGKITATSTNNGAAIGTGGGGTCGNIVISGGEITATGAGGNSAAIGTTSNGSDSVSTCGDIVITTGVTSLTATTNSTPTYVIGIGKDDYGTCSGVYLGATNVDDRDTTTWTPTEGQFSCSSVYGWTEDSGTWTKDAEN